MTTIKNVSKAHCCNANDTTGPQRPNVTMAIASSGIAKEGSTFQANNPPRATPATRDPIYIQFDNHEAGTRYEIVNLSNTPASDFNCKDAIHSFDVTGRDVRTGVGSVFIDTKTVEKLNWDPGDRLMIRAVDVDGNASVPTNCEVVGSGYGTVGRIQEKGTRNWVPGGRIDLLDGEATRKRVMMKYIADDKAPVTKFLEKLAQLKTDKDGQVELTSPRAVEPGARIQVKNTRTQQEWEGTANAEGQLEMKLGKGIANGDTLLVFVRDAANNQGTPAELRYSAKCKDGRASTLGILAARLPGSISVPK